MTPRELILTYAGFFQQSGIPDPEVDASLLLSHLCGKPHLELRMNSDTVLTSDIVRSFQSLAERRMKREPLQYILKEAPFFGYRFEVDSRVLIPRPETELLCEWALEIISGHSDAPVLDLCCGSGCIGISLKLKCPAASVFLSDVSADALLVAESNAVRLNADIHLICGDLFSGLSDQSFYLIVSNPPYIPSEVCRSLQPEVKKEPLLALDGGRDGLDLYRRICSEAPRYLSPGGFLLMELGDGESLDVETIMKHCGFRDISVRYDYQSLPRMICGRIS